VRPFLLAECGRFGDDTRNVHHDKPDSGAIGVTHQEDISRRLASDCIVIGPSDNYELTLAHELGHLFGGHVGGEHAQDPNNLMFHQANDTEKRINLVQQLFFKTSPFAQL
jgi:hypothetical protein